MVEIVVSFLAGASAGVNLAKGLYSWMDGDKTSACIGFVFFTIYAGIAMFWGASL